MEDEKAQITLASYNICADFFSDKSENHKWSKRGGFVKARLLYCGAAAIALQEISAKQGMELFTMSSHRRLVLFQQAATPELKAGTIFTTAEQLEPYLNINFGTPMTGILYDPADVTLEDVGMFWYKPDPLIPPTAMDRGTTDKGFGNCNTPRGPGWCRFRCNDTNKSFIFATVHAPLSGGAKTRQECFHLERKVFRQLWPELPIFSVGDRNILPDSETEVKDTMDALLGPTYGTVYDWFHPKYHVGIKSTWIGFDYEPNQFQAKVNEKGELETMGRLDVGFATIPPLWSAHSHCLIGDVEDGLGRRYPVLEPYGKLTLQNNITRPFASDHCMIMAGFAF